MNDDLRIPDIEIVVRAASSDVAVVSFFTGDSPHSDWEVICGITEQSDIVHIRAALQAAIQAINAASWVSLDVLDVAEDAETQDPPF